MIRLYGFPESTNVERVRLALAHKALPVQHVIIDPADRGEVRRVSGQELVPVLEDDGMVVVDSMEIVRYLEERHPERPLYPQDEARRAEMRVFIDWFNRVWKRAPNAIVGELEQSEPDAGRIARLGREMVDALDLFEAMLAGRDHLMGDQFSAADVAAFPFLKYADGREVTGPHLFHRVLAQMQPLGTGHPRLAEWIRRVEQRPRA